MATVYYPGRGEFTCPLCGSHYFATNLQEHRGQCKGPMRPNPYGMTDYAGCTFTWDRRTQDIDVFERTEVSP